MIRKETSARIEHIVIQIQNFAVTKYVLLCSFASVEDDRKRTQSHYISLVRQVEKNEMHVHLHTL